MVENYFNKELSDITFEIDSLDEWKNICNELGMESQLELTKGKTTPIPYPYMNEVMVRVYETLCPNKTDYKKFKSVTIPLEALKQISFSVRENHFAKIEVWADDKKPDPIIVGYHGYWSERQWYDTSNKELKDKKFSSEQEVISNGGKHPDFNEESKYIIARFGDELKSFDELKKLAIERFIDNYGGELKKDIAVKTEKLKCLNENTISYFNGNMSKHDVVNSY